MSRFCHCFLALVVLLGALPQASRAAKLGLLGSDAATVGVSTRVSVTNLEASSQVVRMEFLDLTGAAVFCVTHSLAASETWNVVTGSGYGGNITLTDWEGPITVSGSSGPLQVSGSVQGDGITSGFSFSVNLDWTSIEGSGIFRSPVIPCSASDTVFSDGFESGTTGAWDQSCTLGSCTAGWPVAGDLLTTEIMQNPAAVSDFDGEWFEILNLTADTIDLDGCSILSNEDPQHPIEVLTIASGDYAVLGNNPDPEINGGILLDYLYSGIDLGNDIDSISSRGTSDLGLRHGRAVVALPATADQWPNYRVSAQTDFGPASSLLQEKGPD